MKKIGFLACADTLPRSEGAEQPRRGDAFEHDLEVAALRPAFAEAGLELVELDWRSPREAFAGLDAVLLGTAWDYQDNLDEFLCLLDDLEYSGIRVYNSAEIVKWNADKVYLHEMEIARLRTIPTIWLEDATRALVLNAMLKLKVDQVVVKRQIGAGGLGQFRFSRDNLPDPDWQMGQACMIQPFLSAILDEGEYTFVFIDGVFSHGVRKRAGKDDYRIQSLYGGYEEAFAPAPEDRAAAGAVIAALPFEDLLYARVDMVRLQDGALAVMECELIEPYLYPEQGPLLGERLAQALLRRLP